MNVGKTRGKKSRLGLGNSGLFGLLDQNLSHDQPKDSEVSLQNYLSFQGAKSVHDAMLEAELKKAEAISLARRYLIGK